MVGRLLEERKVKFTATVYDLKRKKRKFLGRKWKKSILFDRKGKFPNLTVSHGPDSEQSTKSLPLHHHHINLPRQSSISQSPKQSPDVAQRGCGLDLDHCAATHFTHSCFFSTSITEVKILTSKNLFMVIGLFLSCLQMSADVNPVQTPFAAGKIIGCEYRTQLFDKKLQPKYFPPMFFNHMITRHVLHAALMRPSFRYPVRIDTGSVPCWIPSVVPCNHQSNWMWVMLEITLSSLLPYMDSPIPSSDIGAGRHNTAGDILPVQQLWCWWFQAESMSWYFRCILWSYSVCPTHIEESCTLSGKTPICAVHCNSPGPDFLSYSVVIVNAHFFFALSSRNYMWDDSHVSKQHNGTSQSIAGYR